MARKPLAPNDPREGLRRAKLNLARSQHLLANTDFEDYCFDAQQAEKAIKAVFLKHRAPFPYIHDLGQLIKKLAAVGVRVPKYLLSADRLTRYAVATRYLGFSQPVTKAQHARAVRLAQSVVNWAERQIK